MIAPDMATMLSFVLHRRRRSRRPCCRRCSPTGAAQSFNCVTVDGDTSTSDTLLLFATGKAGGAPRSTRADDPALAGFRAALDDSCVELAQLVARDGEGARKFVTVEVDGRGERRVGAPDRACRSPTRRW